MIFCLATYESIMIRCFAASYEPSSQTAKLAGPSKFLKDDADSVVNETMDQRKYARMKRDRSLRSTKVPDDEKFYDNPLSDQSSDENSDVFV